MLGKIKTEEIIKEISQISGINYDLLLNEFVKSCVSMKFVSTEIPILVSQMRSKGIKVVIATDNMDSFSRWTYPGMRLYNLFDGYLNSHYIGALKTYTNSKGESYFFGNYLKFYGLKQGDSILIDDKEDENGLIQSFGIDYYHIESDKELVPTLRRILSSY